MFLLLSLLGLLIVFTALCVVCDEHLVPTVELFITQFNVPEEVAAVTLVAFGSAAPELMLNTMGAAEHDSSLSLPSVLGSAMIAFGLIPATALLFSQHRALQLEVWPLLRETIFYLVGLLLFLKVIADSVTETLEALIMTSVYFLYVGTVVGVHLLKVRSLSVDKEKKTPLEMKHDIELTLRNVRGEDDSEVSELTKNLFPEDAAENESLLLKPSLSIEDLELQMSDDSTAGAFLSSSVLDQTIIQSSTSSQVKVENIWNTVSSPVRTALLYVIPTLQQGHLPSSKLGSETLGSNNSSRMQISTSPASEFIDQIVSPSDATPGGDCTENMSDSEFFADDNDKEGATKYSREIAKKKQFRMIDANFLGLSENDKTSKSRECSHVHKEILEGVDVFDTPKVPLYRAISVLLACLFCIGALASLIIFFCTDLAKSLGVDQSTLGATLVALGAEIPDTVSAIALSRNGLTHGAISGAIGSQVINISLGIGLPALVLCLCGDGKVKLAKEDKTSLGLLVSLVFTVLLSFMLVTIPFRKIISTCQFPRYSHLNRYGAILLLLVWLTAFAAFIVLN